MNVQATTPSSIRIPSKRTYTLAAAVLAAAGLAAGLAVTFGTGGGKAGSAALATNAPVALTAGEQQASNIVSSLTPTQLRGIRYYWAPGASRLTAQEQSYTNAVSALTAADLRGVRSYWAPGPAVKVALLTPAQLRSIRWYFGS